MTAITAEQMKELAPFAQQYQQEKRDAAAQHEAEVKAAETQPNYTSTTKTRKPRKSAEPQPIITITRHSWNHVSRVCYRSFASKPLSQRDEMAYKKAITANQQTEYEAREYNGRLYRVYQTILEGGKATNCTCPANKPCRHMTHYEQVEATRGQSQDSQEERETFGMSLDEACKSAEIAKSNMQLTPEEGAARDAALATARAASDALLAQIDAEVQAQVEQEQAAPIAPKSEMAQIADLPLSENERKETRLASLNEEFPVGMVVPTFHGAGVLVEGGVIVEPVATNFENIDFVVVERMESSERVGISCSDLRCLIRECAAESEIDEEAKIERWTAEELANSAPLNGNRRDGRIMPPPLSQAPTCRKVSIEWLCNRY